MPTSTSTTSASTSTSYPTFTLSRDPPRRRELYRSPPQTSPSEIESRRADESEDNDEDEDDPGLPTILDRRRDPIFWFGGLPPPALREAQAQFRTALQEIVALASHAAIINGQSSLLMGSKGSFPNMKESPDTDVDTDNTNTSTSTNTSSNS